MWELRAMALSTTTGHHEFHGAVSRLANDGVIPVTLLPLCLVMKLIAFQGAPEIEGLGIAAWAIPNAGFGEKSTSNQRRTCSVRRFFVALAVRVCAYWVYWNLLLKLQGYSGCSEITAGHHAVADHEALGRWPVFLALPVGRAPAASARLRDRWRRVFWSFGPTSNVWTEPPVRRIIFRPLRRNPLVALVVVFGGIGCHARVWQSIFRFTCETGINRSDQ